MNNDADTQMVIKGHMNTINSLSCVIAVIDMQLQSASTVSHVTTINTEMPSTQCVNECVVRWCYNV